MATTRTESALSPAQVVETALERFGAGDLAGGMELIADDCAWVNVSLPAVRGKRKIEWWFRGLERGWHFRVHFHNVAERDGVVLTERTDELGYGRFAQRFWVYGRFEVRDGKITLWRDSFDWGDITVSLARGLAGVVAPGLNRRWPG